MSLEWDGLDDFREQLRNLPESLAHDAGAIVEQAATDTGAGLVSNYPQGKTGNLRARVTVTVNHDSRFGASATVKSAAPHAFLYEHGTVQRHTKRGWNRGVMPEAPDASRLIPRAIRARRRMIDQLKALIQDVGFEVTE